MWDMEFYDKFMDRFQDLSKVWNPAVTKAKDNVWGEYDAVTLTMLYLKVPHDMFSQNS